MRTISPEESKEVVDVCLREKGYTQLPNGSFTNPPEQREQFRLDLYICTASYPIGQKYLQPLDEQQWLLLYDDWIAEFIPCLRAAGVNLEPPPTRETFIAAPWEWNPSYSPDLSRQIRAAVREGRFESRQEFLTKVCPVSPGDDVLYGGASSSSP